MVHLRCITGTGAAGHLIAVALQHRGAGSSCLLSFVTCCCSEVRAARFVARAGKNRSSAVYSAHSAWLKSVQDAAGTRAVEYDWGVHL